MNIVMKLVTDFNIPQVLEAFTAYTCIKVAFSDYSAFLKLSCCFFMKVSHVLWSGSFRTVKKIDLGLRVVDRFYFWCYESLEKLNFGLKGNENLDFCP